MSEFINLHTHTHDSAFDGLGTEERFVERVQELKQTAVGFTEHGTLRGLYSAHVACEKAGVKLVPGAELYLADDAELGALTEAEKKDLAKRFPDRDARRAATKQIEQQRRERAHITVWALNDTGLLNLYKLTTWAWQKGFYYKPRIDLKRLEEFNEGLVVTTGCPGGAVLSPILEGDYRTAISRAEILARVFGPRFYVELMPHRPLDKPDSTRALLRIAQEFESPVIATQDAHYPVAEDAPAQDALLCIHTNSYMHDPERFKFDTHEYYLRGRDDMRKAFSTWLPALPLHVRELALDNTVALAESCTARIKTGKGLHPVAPALPAGVRSYEEWLGRLCSCGVRDRLHMTPSELPIEYLERLEHELKTIRSLGFASYFTAVHDIRAWARGSGIFCGPGRGSAAGSLVSYLLEITDLDPLVHKLSFERFLSPGRRDLPDIDIDFEHERRDEVIDYLKRQYGEDHVAHISAHSTLGGKKAVRDIVRIFGIPGWEAAPVAAQVFDAIEEEARDDSSLKRVLEETPAGRAFASKYPEAAEAAARLEGQLRDVSLHASGVLISGEVLSEIVPLETRPRKGGPRVLATAWDMHGAEAAGLVKLDVLGLRTLSILKKAFQDSGTVPTDACLTDEPTLELFNKTLFAGVFQYDSPSARRLCRGHKFKSFDDVAVMTALNRPGPAKTGLARQYIERAAGTVKAPSVHPVYDRVMAPTLGVPVYQEQVVALARELAGYSPEEADAFRKKIAKKIGLTDEEEKFVEGSVRCSEMNVHQARQLFKSLLGFAQYAYGKSHAYSYAMIAWWCMWLKAHHPLAFFPAVLAMEPDSGAQLRIAGEARRAGIPVRSPNVNFKGSGVGLHRGVGGPEIVGALDDIKGIGSVTARAISEGAPYSDIWDFYARTAGAKRRVTSKTFRLLAKANAFRELAPTKQLVENADAIWRELRAGHAGDAIAALEEGDDYTKAALSAAICEVWPLYMDDAGRGEIEEAEARLLKIIARPFVRVDELGEDLGFNLVLGRLSAFRTYEDDDGKKTVKALLTSSYGDELALHVDADVADACEAGLSRTNATVLAALYRRPTGRIDTDSVWNVDELDPERSYGMHFILNPHKTKPRDAGRSFDSANEGDRFSVEGLVLRVRHHIDKAGGRMKTVALLSETGYCRFMVFASRNGLTDAAAIKRGRLVAVRLRKLSDAACLADDEVEVLEPPAEWRTP